MGNRNSRTVSQVQGLNSRSTLQTQIKDNKAKQKNCDLSIKKPKTMRRRRLLNKTKSTRINFNTIKELYGDEMPVMLAFITSESECRLSLSKKPIKCNSALTHSIREKSCRRMCSLPCAKYCKDCKKLSSQLIYWNESYCYLNRNMCIKIFEIICLVTFILGKN